MKEQIFLKKKEKYEAGSGLSELKAEVKKLKDEINKVKKTQDDK